MKMICDVPNEVIKSVRMGTWCGSGVAEKMIANGIPLEQIRAEIEKEADASNRLQGISEIGLRKALKIINKYMAETEDKNA